MSDQMPAITPVTADPPRVAKEKIGGDELIPLDLLPHVRRLRRIFVPPAEFEAFCRGPLADTDERIIVIRGEEASGRTACAIALGSYVTGEPEQASVGSLVRIPGEGRVAKLPDGTMGLYSLEDLVRMNLLREGCAYIVEDLFQGGRHRQGDLGLQALAPYLAGQESWLIFTVLSGDPNPFLGHAVIECELGAPGDEFLKRVLTKHLEEDHLVLPPQVKQAALRMAAPDGRLNTAPRIHRFLKIAAADQKLWPSPTDPEESWTAAAERLAASLEQQLRPRANWFEDLPRNASFLAMLVGALEGIPRAGLEDVYCAQVNRLRAESPGLFQDPRARGFEGLYREICVTVDHDELRFVSESYRKEVIEQMAFEQPLLWEVVSDVGARVKGLDQRSQWRERGFWGEAIARLGIHRRHELEKLLVTLVCDPDAMIATVSAHIMRGLCLLGEAGTGFVLSILESWTSDGVSPASGSGTAADLLWGAADAIGRIYVEFAGRSNPPVAVLARLEALLSRIAGSGERYQEVRAAALSTGDQTETWAREVAKEEFRHALTGAMLAMFRARPLPVAEMLRNWLKDEPVPREAAPARSPTVDQGDKPEGEVPEESGSPEEGDGGDEVSAGSDQGDVAQEVPAAAPEAAAAAVLPSGITGAGDDGAASMGLEPSAGFRTNNAAVSAAVVIRRLFDYHDTPQFLTAERTRALLGLVGRVMQSDREVVNRILEILRNWVLASPPTSTAEGAPKGWSSEILTALLEACDRISEGQRRCLRRGLMTLWLPSHEEEVREIARRVIRRARLLDGSPVDLPGGMWGSILMDDSRAARENQMAPRLAHELCQVINPQLDLWMVRMGNSELLCEPGREFNPHLLHSPATSLRTIAPWLEIFAAAGRPPAAFNLAIHWGDLVDAGDHADPDKRLMSLPIRSEVAALLQLLGFPENWLGDVHEKALENAFEETGVEIDRQIAGELAARPAAEWWSLLLRQDPEFSRRLSVGVERRKEALALLDYLVSGKRREGYVPELRHAGESRAASARGGKPAAAFIREDELRMALGLVQFLAADNLPITIAWLVEQMPYQEPKGNFARAAATLLLRTYFHGGQAGRPEALPPAASHAILLDLAPPLARRRSRLGLQALLDALRLWMGAEDWAVATITDLRGWLVAGENSRLLEMIQAAPRWMREEIQGSLRAWELPGEALDPQAEDDCGEDVRALPFEVDAVSRRLRFEIALLDGNHPRRSERPLPGGFTVVYLVGGDPDDPAASRPWELAQGLHAECCKRGLFQGEEWIFLEAGLRTPLVVPGEPWPEIPLLLSTTLVPSVMPLIESLDSAPLRRLILLAARGVADIADLDERPGTKLLRFWAGAEHLVPGPGWIKLSPGADGIDAQELPEFIYNHKATRIP